MWRWGVVSWWWQGRTRVPETTQTRGRPQTRGRNRPNPRTKITAWTTQQWVNNPTVHLWCTSQTDMYVNHTYSSWFHHFAPFKCCGRCCGRSWKMHADACRCCRSFNWSREKPAALDRASALSRLSRLSRDDMAWWFLVYFALSVPFCAFAADAAPETANAAAVGGATAASVAIAAGVEIMRRYLCKSELRESNYACSHLFMFCWLCLFSPPSRQVQVLHRDYWL